MKVKVLIDNEIKIIKIPYTQLFLLWFLGFLGYCGILVIVGFIVSFIF